MYQALYRKWRPSTFDEVIGQEHITQTLKNQVAADKLSHAYLFIGSRGTGKTTCARILSRAVNCEHPVNGNPCGVCLACRTIMDSSCTDVVELDAASNNGVDSVRALREEAVFSPAAVKYRVYIIDEVHMLSTPAFNALLKILEEPPAHLIFILATTELHKVPATILSRCQRHTFKRIETGLLSEYLQKVSAAENIRLTKDAAEMIAVLSEGGVRDALSILDQCGGAGDVNTDSLLQVMGLAGSDIMFSILDGIISHKTPEVLELFKNLWMEGKDPAAFLDSLRVLLRDILVVSSIKNSVSGLISGRYPLSGLKKFAERLTYEQLVSAINTVQNAFLGMKYTSNTRLSAEICLISLCDDLMTDDISSVKSRISQLEKGMAQFLNGEIQVKRSPSVPVDSIDDSRFLSCKMAVETQPSGSPSEFPDKSGETEPKPDMEKPEETAEPALQAPEAESASFNERLLETVTPRLPVDLRYVVSNSSDLRFTLVDNVLKIEAEPLLMFNRFNRPAVIRSFSESASEICGRDITAIVSKLSADGADNPVSCRLDSLKMFPEVKIIE